MTRFLLVRHGQSVWNAKGRWQGQADPPLSPLGHDQAAVAAEAITSGPGRVPTVAGMEVLVSSDLVRARQTAGAIGAAAGLERVGVEARLRERHAGEWQGLTRNEIQARYPGFLEDGRRPAGWEPDEALRDRAMDALEDLADAHGDTTCVVITHGGVIYTIEGAHGLPHQRIANLGGRWLEIRDGVAELGDRVNLLDGRVEATVPDQI